MKIKLTVYILGFVFAWVPLQAQEEATDSISVNEQKARDLIEFLEFSLNTIGSSGTAPREKDVIITQSYLKFFRDEEVQIEDDLDQDRSTVTNKDVQAYLKDVDFFFHQVHFDFNIEEIQELINDLDEKVYLVKLNRHMNGISIAGDTINETIARYVEINYNEEQDDLKIVSFYTTKLSEEEDLRNWWDELSFEWRYVFQQRYQMYDSVTIDQLKELVAIDSLDLSFNQYITDFDPLLKLDKLRFLNLSNTKIESLEPLRIHNKIEFLNLSHTGVTDIGHIKYATGIRELDLSNSGIDDLRVLENFKKLEELDLSHTRVDSIQAASISISIASLNLNAFETESFDFLSNMKSLRQLDLSHTGIESLEPLSGLSKLESIYLEGTAIKDIKQLTGCPEIRVLNLESTRVSNLDPLNGKPKLEKVYCDQSGITKAYADRFMRDNPNVLIVFESAELKIWWNDLDDPWKRYFIKTLGISPDPLRDELALITQLDSINIEGDKQIMNFKGINYLRNVKKINFSHTFISDISPLAELTGVWFIKGNSSNISHIGPVVGLPELSYLDVSNTRIDSLSGLSRNRKITFLNIDDTRVEESEIVRFIENNPDCMVLYRTTYLESWWEGLSDTWRSVLLECGNIDVAKPDKEQLHRITYLKEIMADGMDIADLSPLHELYFIEKLSLIQTPLSDITGFPASERLKSLILTKSPVESIDYLASFGNLEYIDLSNTAVGDLEPIAGLKNLHVLKLSGTKIKDLKELTELHELQELDISNTLVKSLKPIIGLNKMEMIVTFNSKIKQKAVDQFQESHPACKIVHY